MSKISRLNSLPSGSLYQPADIVILPDGREFILNNSQQWIKKKSGIYLEDKGQLTSENLNLITVQGIYHQIQNIQVTSANNYPITCAGTLEVRFGIDAEIFQQYTVLAGQTEEDTIYTRGNYGGVWSVWKKSWNSGNFNPGSKVNVMENAIGLGFNSGSSTAGVYAFHAADGYIQLATQSWVNTTLQSFASLNWVSQNFIPKTHPVFGITASQIADWDATVTNQNNFLTTNTNQNVLVRKSFRSYGQHADYNNLWIYSDDLSSNPSITFNHGNNNYGQIKFSNAGFRFTDQNGAEGNQTLQAGAFAKFGRTDDRVLLAGGGDKLISDFLNSSSLNGYALESWVNTNFIPKTHPVFNVTQAMLDSYATYSWTQSFVASNYIPQSHPIFAYGQPQIDDWTNKFNTLPLEYTQPSHDVNNIVKSGFYRIGHGSVNAGNYPINAPQDGARMLLHFETENIYSATQIQLERYNGNLVARVKSDGGWSGWIRHWASNDFTLVDVNAWKAIVSNQGNFVTTNTVQPIYARKTINVDLGTNEYIGVAQHFSQFQIGKLSDAKSLEFAVLDNGTSVIQSKEAGVGYHPLILNRNNAGGVAIGGTPVSNHGLTIGGSVYSVEGYHKEGSDNNWLLLGGGGHRNVNDFIFGSNGTGSIQAYSPELGLPINSFQPNKSGFYRPNAENDYGSLLLWIAHPSEAANYGSGLAFSYSGTEVWLTGRDSAGNKVANKKIWHENNFNPGSKVNALENASAIGFSNGDSEAAPYFYHATNGYRFLATQTWVSQQGFASNTSLNSYLPKTGGSMSGMILFDNNLGGIQGTMADNDFWRVVGGNTGSNNGYLELATGDDSNEEIYVSQYAGQFTSLVRRAKLLAADGNTYFPQTVSANAFVKNGSSGDLMLMGNGSEVSRYLFDSNFVNSGRNFPNGTLIQTSIDYSQSAGDAWILEIKGNTYGRQMPINMTVQGYIYSNTIISIGAYSTIQMNGFIALNLNGKLCFWFPSMGYWEGYSIKCYDVMGGVTSSLNRVISIDNANDPGGTKRVAFTVKVLATNDNTWNKYIVNGFTGINATTPFAVLNGTVQQSILTGGLLASDDYNDVSKIPYLGIHSKGLIQSEDGFQNRTYKVNQRNKIWNFGDSSQVGLSYYHGSYNALGEGIAFHFGDATDYKFYIKDNGNTYQRGSVNINVPAGHIFLSENNVNKWHIESVGGEFNITQSGGAQRFRILPNASTPTYNNFGLWHEGNYNPFKNLRHVANLNDVSESGIYRQEDPTSGYPYTTTLNLNSADGRQQLTIEHSGGGMKFRGTVYGSGDQGWTPWAKVWSDLDFTTAAITGWQNMATNGVTKGDDQTITGLKKIDRWQGNYGSGWGNLIQDSVYGLVFETGVGSSTTDNYGSSIGFRSGNNGIQAGIHVRSNGNECTSMAFSTTHSFAGGPQIGMTMNNYGVVNFTRSMPTYQGLVLVTQNYVDTNFISTGFSAQIKFGELTLNSGLGLPSGQRIALKGLGDVSHYIKHFTSDDSVGFGINTKFVVKPYNNEGINFFSVDGNGLTTMKNAQINGILKFKVTQFDLTGLDPNTYYPVTLSLSTNRYTKIKVYRTLDGSYGVPPYSNHGAGFMCMFEIDVLGHGLGTTDGKAYLREYKNFWVNSGIETIGYKQMNNSTQAVVYLRGGSKYDFEADIENTPILRTSYYEIYGEVTEPTTTRIWQQFVDSRTDTLLNSFVTTNTDQKISGVKQFNAFGGSYTQFALQAYSDTGASPGIAFHKSGYYAASLQLVANDLFSFRNISGTLLADIQAKTANLSTFNAEAGKVFGELYVGGKVYSSEGFIHNSYNDYDQVLTSDGQARPISDFQGSGTRVKFELVTSGQFNPPDEKDLHFNLVNDSNMKLYLENLSSTSYGMVITVTHRNSGCVTQIWRGGNQLSGFSNNKQHKFMYTPLGWQWIDDTNSTSWI